ncbi:MAG: hypothetical protein LBG95_00100 [Treponema sp.]|jgi:hypothetical protein|nr:hypothetical protein [Treponema sp.]
MVFEKCREILLKESELVQRIAGLQNHIRESVISRNWADFESHFSGLGRIKAELGAMEHERESLFAGIPEETSETSRFYSLAANLPSEQRAELTAIYRGLKLETLRVQMAGESLMKYISEARATIAVFFEAAFPDRGGKIYTPYGIPVSHDMRSMVLNRAF